MVLCKGSVATMTTVCQTAVLSDCTSDGTVLQHSFSNDATTMQVNNMALRGALATRCQFPQDTLVLSHTHVLCALYFNLYTNNMAKVMFLGLGRPVTKVMFLGLGLPVICMLTST
jgi:hypothetical protein